MRYEDARRLRGAESFWLYLKLLFHPTSRRSGPLVHNLSHLSDYEMRDIGLPDQIRYVDWRALRESGWS